MLQDIYKYLQVIDVLYARLLRYLYNILIDEQNTVGSINKYFHLFM